MNFKFEFVLLKKYKDEKRKREIEKNLIDAMYQASSLSNFMSIEDIFKTLAESGYGALSDEFNKVYNKIKTGASVEDAVEKMIKHSKSSVVRRGMNILITGYKTGADISEALREIADDAAETYSTFRERAAAMTIEKYTLLMAGALIVPVMLGAMLSLITSLDLGSLSEFGLGLSETVKNEILGNATLGNNFYIAIYAVMASVFVAYQENKIEKSLVYILLLLPCSLFLFNFMINVNL